MSKNVNINILITDMVSIGWLDMCHRMLGVCENARKTCCCTCRLLNTLHIVVTMRIHIRFIALFLVAIAGAAAFRIYHDSIVEAIQRVAIRMRAYPYSSIILGLMILATSTPPMLGFTFLVTLSGFVYGFPQGVAPAMIGGYVGALICFGLIRHYNFARFIRLSPSKQEKYHAIQEAIAEGGFGMLLMIRLTPIPWQFTNMILALIPTLSPKRYAIVTFIASWKLCLEVWFGSQLASLSDPDLPPSAHRLTMVTLGVGVLILVGLALWLHRLTLTKVKQRQTVNQGA